MEAFKAMDKDQDGKVSMDDIVEQLADGHETEEENTRVKDLLKVHFPAAD